MPKQFISRHAPGMEKFYTPKEPYNPGPVGLDKWILNTGGKTVHQLAVAIAVTLLIGLISLLVVYSFGFFREDQHDVARKLEDERRRELLQQQQAAAEGGGQAADADDARASGAQPPRGGLTRRRGGGTRRQHATMTPPQGLALPGSDDDAAEVRCLPCAVSGTPPAPSAQGAGADNYSPASGEGKDSDMSDLLDEIESGTPRRRKKLFQQEWEDDQDEDDPVPEEQGANDPEQTGSKGLRAGPGRQQQGEATNPYDRYIGRIDRVVKQQVGGVGTLLLRGVPPAAAAAVSNDETDADGNKREEEEEEEEEEEDSSKFTEEEMADTRWIIITERRQQSLQEMRHELFASAAAADKGQLDQQLGAVDVLSTFEAMTDEIAAEDEGGYADYSHRFDDVWAFTWLISEHDTWLYEHGEPAADPIGWGGEIFLEELGLLWAELLLFDDEVLGIDAAFTRPGVVAMLEQLQEKVEFASAMAGPGDGPMLSFVFRPEDIDASAIG